MTELAKNQTCEVNIEGCTAEGQGVARIDGRAVFVAGALPGERCTIKILKVSKTAIWAKLDELLDASPHRIEPDCPVCSKCGGCDFRHVSYEEELRIKKQRVDDALRRIGGLELVSEEILPSPQQERYRNKAILNVGERGGKAVTGFYRPRSHDIVPIESCLLQDTAADTAAAVLRRWMDQYSVPAYDELSGRGIVRRLFVRSVKHGVCVCIVAAADKLPHCDKLIDMLREACPALVSVVLNVNRSKGNGILSDKFLTLWGEDSIDAELCSLRFKLSPRSFFQINTPQAEKLYARAIEYAGLSGTERVLDLYCGTGTIGLCAAAQCAHVTGAEIVNAAIEDAKENARRNGIENADFICADASDAARHFADIGMTPDVIIVDPPRKGLAPDVINSIVQMAPARVVYVSCDPATLARDLKLFNEKGYKATRLTAADMFPRTRHVESVALLCKAAAERGQKT